MANLFLLVLMIAAVVVFLRIFIFGTGLIYVLKRWMRSIEDGLHVYQFFKVPQFNESFQENQLYRKISIYVNSLASIEDLDSTNLFSGKRPNDIVLGLDHNQPVHDTFLGARVSWTHEHDHERNSSTTFVLMIRKKDKRRILRPYLQHIHSVFDDIELRRRELKLYTNSGTGNDDTNGRWRSVPFTHPSTLDTVAMESDLKNKIKSDLESFLKSKQYYHRLGRVWKRSYLLYGPSGTGKTSFVAAVAKFLCYDVYDVDLSKVMDDSDLKLLLLQTTGRSVIVVEDLDRFITEKSTAVTLSGILNFMDGIVSCCGEERVMMFTMNSKDQVDPAILRPGRIDVHIHFPLCDFSAFKTLANSYLGLKHHKLFPQVEEVFQSGATMSPAEIGELMIANRSSPSRALKSVITALQSNCDGRGSGKLGRRLVADTAPSRTEVDSVESCGVICKESVHSFKDFSKLYGLLRIKSNRKSASFDLSTVRKDS